MKQTTNFHLNKPDTTDYYNIQDSNNNMDIIDAEIKEAKDKADQAFQSASNGKAAIKTAITGVDPTVTIPTDATFNQLAASIGQIKTGVDTGDATAAAGDIVAPKTAYVKGVKVTGNIPTKAAAIYTPGTADQTIAAKQYLNGDQTIKGDVNLIPANILAGKTVFNVTGTASTEKYDFPLSIQDAQPTAIAVGHIWVKSSTLAANITIVKIMEALNAGAANGTLMLVVGTLTGEYQAISQSKTLKSGSTVTLTVDGAGNVSSIWTVNTSGGTIKLPKPMVYSKVGGVLDIETAYMWDGNSWVLLSQKGAYVFSFSGATSVNNYIYNKNGDTLVQNSAYKDSTTYYFYGGSYSADGTFVSPGGRNIYKRVGDVFSLFYTIPLNMSISGYTIDILYITKISLNGNRIVALYRANDGASGYYPCVISYYYNGTTFVQEAVSIITGNGFSALYGFDITPDGSFFALLHNGYIGMIYGFINGAAFTVTKNTLSMTNIGDWGATPSILNIRVDRAGNSLWYTYIGSGNWRLIAKLSIDKVNKTLTPASGGTSNANYGYLICGIHPVSGDLFAYLTTNGAFFVISGLTGTYTALTAPLHKYAMQFNADGTRMIAMDNYSGQSYSIGYYSVSGTGSTTTFTLVTSIADQSNAPVRIGTGIVPA